MKNPACERYSRGVSWLTEASRHFDSRPRAGALSRVIVLIAFGVCAAAPAGAQQLIRPGVPVQHELSTGHTDVYRLQLDGERFVRIAVDQQGVDVVVAVRDAAGRSLREENRLGNRGTELLPWTSPGPGVYDIAVTARGLPNGSGSYQLRVELSAADERLDQAIEKYTDGWRLVREGRSGYSTGYANTFYVDDSRFKRALADFEEALPVWQDVGDRELAAVTLHEIGFLSGKLNMWTASRERLEQALAIDRSVGQRTEEALVLNDLGSNYDRQGDYANGSKCFAEALALLDAMPASDAAELLFNQAVTLQNLSKLTDALALFQRAREAFRALGEKDLELLALSELGRTQNASGHIVESLDLANTGLSLSRAYRMPLLEARFAQDIGRLYIYLDDYEEARQYCERAIALFRGQHYPGGEIAALLLLGDAQHGLDEADAALRTYDSAASLAHAINFAEAEARAAVKASTVLSEQGELSRALDYSQRALSYYRTTGNHRSEVTTLLALGQTYRRMGDTDRAAATLREGLRVSRDAAAGAQETPILGELALVARDAGKLDDARIQLAALLQRFEAERRSLLAPTLSATFLNGAENWYDVYADVLMRLHEVDPQAGYDKQAWSAAEHARAWGLLQMLADGRSDLTSGVDRALLDRRRALWSRMSARAGAAERADADPTARAAPDRAAIDDIAAQLRVIEARIRSSSPHYVGLVEPSPITSDEVQKTLLDDRTVLLEFALGDEESWVWAITTDTVRSFKLPPRADIDAAARRAYALLTRRQTARGTPQPSARIAAADAALPRALRQLTRMLIAPMAPQLEHDWQRKRLVVITSGSLDYVPFSILTQASGRPLLADHEIVSLPSATVLAELRRDAPRRPAATRTLALIADPVFDSHDPRLAHGVGDRGTKSRSVVEAKVNTDRSAAAVADVTLQRRAAGMTRSGFARLPFSREEATAIAQFAPAGSVLEATDFRASHDLAVSGQLAEYRFVHFATHGLLNSRHPELSGLVLSLVDQNGRPVNGFLRLGEIYNLHLGAELVVLSACQTGLGKEIKGDGLVGLTRGFMYAGAERVVASLWQVDDLATSELMRAFYRGMLKDRLAPAAALRAAQLQMMKQKRWAAPYYWAAFTLQGEWR